MRAGMETRPYIITRTSNARPYKIMQKGWKDSSHSLRMTSYV